MQSDAELLYAWREGDVASGQQLFKRYYGPVARFFANKIREEVGDLMGRYDRIVFSAAPGHAAMAHRALHRLDFYLVAICGRRLARRSILTELREIAPIDACLSET